MNPYRSPLDTFLFLLKIVTATLLVTCLGRLARISDYLTLTFVTLLCLSPTTLGGLRIGLEQLVVALGSSFLSLGLASLVGDGLFAVACSLAVVAAVLMRLRQESLLPIAYFSALYIAYYHPPGAPPALFERIEHLLIGIPLAAVLNLAFGAASYRHRLLHGLHSLRHDLFEKTARILEAVIGGSVPTLERELRGTEAQYTRAAEIVRMLEVIEREQGTPLAPLFGALPPAREYKLYAWNLRDLMQNAHAAAVLCFKVPLEDTGLRDLLVVILREVRRETDEPGAGSHDSVEAPPLEPSAPPALAAFHGNLVSMLIHLRAIRGLEKERPELSGRTRENPAG